MAGHRPTRAGPEQLEHAGESERDALATIALALLPGALIVYMGFNAGGYFPAAPAIAAILLAQLLLVRVLIGRNPFAGFAPATAVAVFALAAYAALTLASGIWAHAHGRALIEFDRALFYLLVLVLFGSIRASRTNIRWLIRGLVVGAVVVCLAGLISRLAPDVWRTAPDVANQRLSYPVTYWNALGLLAALAIIFALHLSCSHGESRWVRVSAAGALPLLAATLFFTFSRGAIAAGAIGLLAYVLLARPRGLLAGALAAAPPTAALIVIAYHANLLDTVDPTTPAAVSQGHRVALAALLSAAVSAGLRLLFLAKLDPVVGRRAGTHQMHRSTRTAIVSSAVAGAVLVGLALGAPQGLAHDWNRFFSGVTPHGNSGDLRQRLTDPSNNGRSELWSVAMHGFSAAPVAGHGAGMYQTLWDRQRTHFSYVVNAHSLYLQAMAELGLPGVLLLAILIGAVLAGLAMRARGPGRSLYGALIAGCLVWAIHAGVDWDWEMPVITLPFFAVAGLALSPRGAPAARGSARARTTRAASRAVIAAACIAAVVLPVLVIGSQNRLTQAERALYASNCPKAISAARSSSAWLSARPEPYEIVGFCDIERGQTAQAIAEMHEAVDRDPESWERYYALAIADAAAGADPRPAARRALQLNPLEPLTRRAARALDGPGPASWVRGARLVREEALASNDLSIVPS